MNYHCTMNKKIKLLLVEDEVFLGRIVKETLEKHGFEVVHEIHGGKVLELLNVVKPDICVFDVMLPGKDGFTLVEEIRKTDKRLPVIFLTSKSMTEDVVRGFEKGGNDYLRKPFSMEELIVRINALLQRTALAPNQVSDSEQAIGKYMFHALKNELRIEKMVIKLTSRETDLLTLLIQNKNTVLDKKAALIALWGDDSFFNGRSMDVFITKLRKHFSKDKNIEIVNIRGQGYKLIVE